jgi:hypothetical protein
VARDETETQREGCGQRFRVLRDRIKDVEDCESTQERKMVIKHDALLYEQEGRFICMRSTYMWG